MVPVWALGAGSPYDTFFPIADKWRESGYRGSNSQICGRWGAVISSVFTRKEVTEEDILQREHRNWYGMSDNMDIRYGYSTSKISALLSTTVSSFRN